MSERNANRLLVTLITTANLLLAFFVSGLVVWSVGENPFRALEVLIYGAFGYSSGLGYTLYYTTNYVFTGLAFAIAFHARLFNIGAEGQAYIGGLGVGLACLATDSLPFLVIFPLALIGGMLFGAVWGAIPGWLQARRGSHIVITTIMFNFIASAVMVWLLSELLIKPGQMSPETRELLKNAWLPQMHELFGSWGVQRSPLNASFFLALACCVFVWRFIWHTRWGYELRTVGANEQAAVYGGIHVSRNLILAMALSGALAGLVGINEIMGVQHRVLLNFQSGYGFTGIAVSLIGRNHPLGILLAAMLFGALYQGGAELAFEMDRIDNHMVILIQALVILFAGALENLFKPQLEALVKRLASSGEPRVA